MTPLAVGPVICILGVVAAYFALRTKANSKKSMYRKLRDERERQIRAARQRAQQAKERQLQAERDRAAAEEKAAKQAAAAAAAPTAAPEPASTARLDEPARQTPMYEPPPATAHEPEPEPESEPEPEPQPEPEVSTAERVEPSVPEFEPVAATKEVEAPAPAEAEPEAVPAADGGHSSWEIVTPEKETEPVAAATAARPASGHAEWEIASSSPEPAAVEADQKSKRKDKAMEMPAQDDEKVGGGPLQTVLSYAGLVAALAIILLGIVFMIGSKATG